MSKGSVRRPEDNKQYESNYDRIFNMQDKIYFIETPKEIYWSPRKLDVAYKHIEFLYRDKAKAKELPEDKFKSYQNRSKKKLVRLQGDD